jgi:integrase
MGKLTAIKVRNTKEAGRLADGEGLSFEVTKSGVKRWLYRYRLSDKQQTFVVGRYPDLSLEQAREAHREVKKLVKQGYNPAKVRRDEKQKVIDLQEEENEKRSNSFKNIALEWLENKCGIWSEKHQKNVRSTLLNDVFPYLGHKPVNGITPQEVLKMVRKVEERGALEIARRTLQRVNSVFRYSIRTGRSTLNPAADMHEVLKDKPPVKHLPSVIDNELGKLMYDITNNNRLNIVTTLALKFQALTVARPIEVRLAKWQEIKIEKKMWELPAERMKNKLPHIVPLSKQAIKVLQQAGEIWGEGGLIFPSVRDWDKPMSDNTLGKALRDMGYQSIATAHGFRSSFSTMANEQNISHRDVIEKCLSHVEKNKVRGSYNRAEYIDQRKDLLRWWGDKLEELERRATLDK